MSHRTILFIARLICFHAAFLMGSNPVFAGTPGNFKSKVLVVETAQTDSLPKVLIDASIEAVAGHPFIIGEPLSVPGYNREELASRIYIPLANVRIIMEFADFDKARSFLESKYKASQEPIVFNSRSFVIPFLINKEQNKNVKTIRLFVARDSRGPWESVGEVDADAEGFKFTAPSDGTFYFAVQQINADKTKEPEDEKRLTPALVVHVRSGDKDA